MKQKKWPYVVGIIILTLFLLIIYQLFNGNPISKSIGKYHLEVYLKETYPNENFEIKDSFYKNNNQGYEYRVINLGDITERPYTFYVKGLLNGEIIYDEYDDVSQIDESLTDKFQDEAQEHLVKVFKTRIPEMVWLDVSMKVYKDIYDEDMEWNNTLELAQPMEILILLNDKIVTKEQLIETAKKVQDILADDYDYQSVWLSVRMTSNDPPLTKYHLEFEKGERITENLIMPVNHIPKNK